MQNKDSIKNTIFIGLGLCLICAAVISFIAVGLKQLQKQNIILDQQKKIVAAANLEDFYGSVSNAYNSIEEIIIDLDTGNFTDLDPSGYDLSKELQDSSMYINLSSAEDIATIKVRENYSKVFFHSIKLSKLDCLFQPLSLEFLYAHKTLTLLLYLNHWI